MMARPQIMWLVGLLLAATLALIGVIWPLQDWRTAINAQNAEINATRERLSQSVARLNTEAQSFADDTALPLVWRAPQTGQVTAQVQAELGRLASQTGVSLRSTTPTGVRDIPFADAVAFRLEGEGSLNQWRDLLVQVEYHEPPILIERGTLRRLIRPGATPEQPVLFVQLDLIAPVAVAEQ